MKLSAFKKKLVLLLAMILVISSVGSSFAVVAFSDLNKAEWAKETIMKWTGYGLVSGYNDGTFKPSKAITRAEFAVMAFKAFDLESNQRIPFNDMVPSDWFYQEVSKMAKLGYINGYEDGSFRPNAPITRAEAAAIITNIMGLAPSLQSASTFVDMDATPAWAKGYIGAAAKAGFISGYTDGSFRATKNITRAESVAMLNNTVYGQNHFATDWRIVKPGTYGGTKDKPLVVEGNVYIKSPDVILNNVEVKGKMIVGVEVGEGDVALNDVVVAGDMNIFGGGANSVKINGGSYGKIFVMKAATTPVRLLVVNVKNVDVVIPAQAEGRQIILEGLFNSVSVFASKAQISTQGNTTINEIKFDKVAIDVVLKTSTGTVIAKAIVNVVLTVLGQGRIITAEVNVQNVTFEKQPETVNNVPTTTTPPTGGGTVTPPVVNNPNYEFLIVKGATEQLVAQEYYTNSTGLSFSMLSDIYEDNKSTFTEITEKYEAFFNEALVYEVKDKGHTFAYALASRIDSYDGSRGALSVFNSELLNVEEVLANPNAVNYETIKPFASVMAGSPLFMIFDDLEKLYFGDNESLSDLGLTMKITEGITYAGDVANTRFFLNYMYTNMTIAVAAAETQIFSLTVDGGSTVKFVVKAIN